MIVVVRLQDLIGAVVGVVGPNWALYTLLILATVRSVLLRSSAFKTSFDKRIDPRGLSPSGVVAPDSSEKKLCVLEGRRDRKSCGGASLVSPLASTLWDAAASFLARFCMSAVMMPLDLLLLFLLVGEGLLSASATSCSGWFSAVNALVGIAGGSAGNIFLKDSWGDAPRSSSLGLKEDDNMEDILVCKVRNRASNTERSPGTRSSRLRASMQAAL
eukprot:scaffold169_cov155-Pinguiococcus_pyrenoidosus.AAC.1